MSALGVERPTVVPRVTGYIQRIIDFVQKLERDGFAYECAGSVYFDTAAFEAQDGHEYGLMGGSHARNDDDAETSNSRVQQQASSTDAGAVELGKSNGSIDDVKSAAVVGRNTHVAEKRSARDFALWKNVEVEGEDAREAMLGDSLWKSPWGFGRPGWHVECSAMIEHSLGKGKREILPVA
jgi:cysteinyl-tRNA synthetase